MKSLLKTLHLLAILAIVILFGSHHVSAQNYFPLQTDSLQFFYGPPFTNSSPSMNPPQGSSYRVIKIDSISNETNNIIYHSIRTTRDTALNIMQCLDVNGGSWLGDKIIHDANQNLIFLNNKKDSIFLKYLANVGESWLFYSYSDNSKIYATVSLLSIVPIFSTNDSIKKITLQYFNSLGQPAIHPVNGK